MQLAQTRDDLSSADAFILGLFQDIGTLQLSYRRPDLAPAIEALQHHPGAHRSDAEALLAGRNHIDELLSSPLGTLLSQQIRSAISTHHRPDHPLAAFAKAVDAVADVVQVGQSCEGSAEECLRAVNARSSLDAILQSSEAETKRLAKLIRLPLLRRPKACKPTQTDALSSLANHSQLTRELEGALLQNQYGQQSLSVILLNVDRFQLLNEFYGHPAGDLLLRTIAERISNSTRLSDRLGRLGGDVFCMILPDTSMSSGQVVAERIRTLVERTEVLMGDIRAGCSVSLCGVTIAPGSKVEPAQLLQSMEESMESSRNKGRNRVYWQETQPKGAALSPAVQR
jgi:diguanylate cyclase (GGDEF)-like protein